VRRAPCRSDHAAASLAALGKRDSIVSEVVAALGRSEHSPASSRSDRAVAEGKGSAEQPDARVARDVAACLALLCAVWRGARRLSSETSIVHGLAACASDRERLTRSV